MPDLTHEVFNQPEPLVDYNLFESNRALRDALKLNAPRLDTAELSALGATLGSARHADPCPAGQRAHAAAAQPRPLWPAHRRGRVPSRATTR